MKKIGHLIICLIVPLVLFSQEEALHEERLIQISGVVVNAKDYRSIPFANVFLLNKGRGTVSSFNGFFSIIGSPSDTIQFSIVGYKRQKYIVPDSIEGFKTSLIVALEVDTLMLDVVEVYPWPSRSEFKDAFLSLKIKEQRHGQISALAGFRRLENPIEPSPTLMNPISYLYENVFKKIKERMPNRRRASELPKW